MQLYFHTVGSGGLEVAFPLHKPKIERSTLARVDRFSGCENHLHSGHMILWQLSQPCIGKKTSSLMGCPKSDVLFLKQGSINQNRVTGLQA
ncbi:hypothetical protein TNCV_3786111 [Trichonephila clavipes]|nr:hypothetical protein TNCV_3786111 [Trichonephila clavipes]